MDLSFILNELGEEREMYANATVPPIFQTGNFGFRTVAQMRHALKNESSVPFYSRGFNPTLDLLNQKMAALEGAEAALSFASGTAALAAAIMLHVKAGDHIVCVKKPYSWTNKLLTLYLPRFGVTTTMVDGTDPENFRAAIQPNTKVVYLETPNSFTFEQQDIAAVAAIAKAHDAALIVDNSYATPLFQQPILLGADMTIHSATKYLGGHSDALGGVVCGSRADMEKMFASEYMTIGGVMAPFNAWLILRGLRTLSLRMERVAQSGQLVAEFLAGHPKVEHVYYPFLPTDPQYELAKKQMKNGAGQFSAVFRATDQAAMEKFCDSMKRFVLGASWGGYESLMFPACTLADSANYSNAPFPFNLIRFYIGLEEPQVLIEDLAQALAGLEQALEPAKTGGTRLVR